MMHRIGWLATSFLAGWAIAQTPAPARPLGGGPAPVAPTTQPGGAAGAGAGVTPGLPAPAGLPSPTPYPGGLPSPVPFPGGTPSSVIAPPAGSPMPGTGLPSAGPAEINGGGTGGATGTGTAGAPPAPGLPPTALQITQSFMAADADRDGDLTRAEAQRLTVLPQGLSFEDMDANKDGRLSRSEYDASLGR